MEETKVEKLEMSEAALEKMKELHPHVEEARIYYERGNMDLPEKQKEIFKAGVKKISARGGQALGWNDAESKEHAEVIKGLNQEERLQELVNMAFNEDPIKASQISLEFKDPYIEDKLHDILVERYDELRKSGKLKEV